MQDHPLSATPTPLRTQLLTPIIGAILLLSVFAAVVLSLLWEFQRDQVEARHAEAVRTLAVLIGRDTATTTQHLAHMATSPLITDETMHVFADRCREILKFRSDWANIVLIDRSGRQLINTLFERGAALPTNALQDHHVRTFASARPQVSGVFLGSATRKWTVAVTVPVVRDGAVVYALSVGLRPEVYDEVLAERVARAGGVAALMDAEHRFIARSMDGARMRGERPQPRPLTAMRGQERGAGRFDTIEGDPMALAWEPVPGTRWTVAVGIPAAIGLGLGPYLSVLAGAALLILGAAVIVALRRSRRIAHAVAVAGDNAVDVAAGRPVTIPRTNVLELDRMGDALLRSAAVIAAAQAEKERLLEQERAARAVAEAANKAKDELLAMLGHELRNPLAAISTSVHLLNRADRSTETLQFAHGIITRQTTHLSRLVDDLLDVGRVITGKMRLRKLTMDLSEAAVSVVEALKASGDTDHHQLVLDAQPVHVNADFTRMHQVVMNLLTNALKYTSEGGTIYVSVKPENGQAVLSVRDTGVGMTADERERVFEMFYQGSIGELKSRGGLGLGLLLVRRIVEQHGGTVVAESAGRGAGSIFTVRMPALAVASPSVNGASAPRRAATCSVLLIEDNEDMRAALRIALEAEGHKVAEAEDGSSGLAAALSMRPHVAIVDIGLPGVSGYRIAETLRAKTGHAIFLIALTGHGQPGDVRRAAQAGFDTHMVKPPDMNRLTRMLAGLGHCDGGPAGEARKAS